MNVMQIGDVIRNRRIELGITQEDLCNGICNSAALSRIENGKQKPTQSHLSIFLQRLGLSEEQLYTLISAKEFSIQCLQQEIQVLNSSGKKLDALNKLSELEKIISPNDTILQQFILRSKIVAGKRVNGSVEPFTLEEQLDLLLKAIKFTVPKFDIDKIEKHLLCFEEVKIINHIAITYAELGEASKALKIYRQLFAYTDKHYVDMSESASIMILVSYNYSKYLGLAKRYEEAIEVANVGRQHCIKYHRSTSQGKLLGNLAYGYHVLGRHEESKKCLYQAYYLFRANEDDLCCKITANNAWEWYQIKFQY